MASLVSRVALIVSSFGMDLEKARRIPVLKSLVGARFEWKNRGVLAEVAIGWALSGEGCLWSISLYSQHVELAHEAFSSNQY